MNVPFVKMHGLGNDYLYIDAFSRPEQEQRHDLPALARAMSDRHRGIGSDGLILVAGPVDASGAHVRMRMFNADGSESEMCGNGVRCVAKFAHDRLGLRQRPLLVETGRGVLSIDYSTQDNRLVSATVDMGPPTLELSAIPVLAGELVDSVAGPGNQSSVSSGGHEHALAIRGAAGGQLRAVFVSMGNPHAVFFDQPMDLAVLGRVIEHHPAFPRRINAHSVQVKARDRAVMIPWERGAGFTQACGTGACAVLVAGVLTGRLDREATITLPGGDLRVRWDSANGHVFMTGPAADVFEGTWPLPDAAAGGLPLLSSERLLLRPLSPTDAAALHRLANNEAVSKHLLSMPHPYTLTDAHRFISVSAASPTSGQWTNWAATLKQADGRSGEFIGVVGLRVTADHDRAEVGYWLGQEFWGRGLAAEALRALMTHGFGTLGLNRLYGECFVENPASARVMAKAGMKPEGTLKGHLKKAGEHRDNWVWGITRSEWTP